MQEEEMLTISEVARELRCSKAHAGKAINGKLRGVSPLPAISMGRRKLVRRTALERWKCSNERTCDGVTITPSLKVHAVDA
jgi:hypothetical protein